MDEDPYIQIGEIYREHGIRGDVTVYLYSRSSENFRQGMRVVLRREDGAEQTAVLESVNPYKQWFLSHFSLFNKPEAAKSWRKAAVLIKQSELAPPEKGEYYLFQLIGFMVVDTDGRILGTLTGMEGAGEAARFIVEGQNKQEILIPAVSEWIQEVDYQGRKIVVKMQEGL